MLARMISSEQVREGTEGETTERLYLIILGAVDCSVDSASHADLVSLPSCLFLIFVAQHWLITVMGIVAMALVYTGIVPQADQANIEKFGDEYRRYMQRMPVR